MFLSTFSTVDCDMFLKKCCEEIECGISDSFISDYLDPIYGDLAADKIHNFLQQKVSSSSAPDIEDLSEAMSLHSEGDSSFSRRSSDVVRRPAARVEDVQYKNMSQASRHCQLKFSGQHQFAGESITEEAIASVSRLVEEIRKMLIIIFARFAIKALDEVLHVQPIVKSFLTHVLTKHSSGVLILQAASASMHVYVDDVPSPVGLLGKADFLFIQGDKPMAVVEVKASLNPRIIESATTQLLAEVLALTLNRNDENRTSHLKTCGFLGRGLLVDMFDVRRASVADAVDPNLRWEDRMLGDTAAVPNFSTREFSRRVLEFVAMCKTEAPTAKESITTRVKSKDRRRGKPSKVAANSSNMKPSDKKKGLNERVNHDTTSRRSGKQKKRMVASSGWVDLGVENMVNAESTVSKPTMEALKCLPHGESKHELREFALQKIE